MKPNDQPSENGGKALSRPPLEDGQSRSNSSTSQDAAANVVRLQIDQIFDKPAESHTAENPYERSYQEDESKSEEVKLTNDWNKYHTAWQNYYQKYYEGYYKHQAKLNPKESDKTHDYFRDVKEPEPQPVLTKKQAMDEVRQEVVGKVKQRAEKVRKSRHFLPIISGVIVVLFFLFLQFNQFLIANVVAYVSPGSIDPQNLIVDPDADLTVPPDPKLIIPKINVDVPVYYDIGNDYNSQMAAMAKGVAQFSIPGADAHPGQVGNTVISGHSSNDWLDSGDYKFIFAQLEKLQVGDTIYLNYKSKRYTYFVTRKQVVSPTDVSALQVSTDKPMLTLVTCTPLGTSLNRLLVFADQVSPDPASASKSSSSGAQKTTSMPGSSPTLLERIFGAK